jgi:hypothetical protein
MLERSYVTPVQRLTGDFMTSIDIGHLKKVGTVIHSSLFWFAIFIIYELWFEQKKES